MNLADVTQLVQHSTALRARTLLEPAGGQSDKIFPPTYEGGKYATEVRRIDGAEVACVLLDSVQSQANRFESALQDAVDGGRLSIPVIRVSFPDDLSRELGSITSLTAPHRCYDAIIRDSRLGETAFPKSELGAALAAARPPDATALYRHCPTVLVFGGWDSTGSRGGMGAKFTRAVTSEIVGIGVAEGVRTSSRIDPLSVRREVEVVVEDDDRSSWRVASTGEKKTKRPSEVNHGNIVPIITKPGEESGGVTVDGAEQTWVLSLPALRRYRFPVDGEYDDDRDLAVRSVLVVLALVARALAHDDGLFLRSRCHLVRAPGASGLEAVAPDGPTSPLAEPTADELRSLLEEAVEAASTRGLDWEGDPVELQAEERLVELVRRSFELAPKADA